MYYRVQIDQPESLEPTPRWLKADSYFDAYSKAKKRFKNRIVSIIDMFEFSKVWYKD